MDVMADELKNQQRSSGQFGDPAAATREIKSERARERGGCSNYECVQERRGSCKANGNPCQLISESERR
jgi:hypothetical protein